jgi:hypothetical protein
MFVLVRAVTYAARKVRIKKDEGKNSKAENAQRSTPNVQRRMKRAAIGTAIALWCVFMFVIESFYRRKRRKQRSMIKTKTFRCYLLSAVTLDLQPVLKGELWPPAQKFR